MTSKSSLHSQHGANSIKIAVEVEKDTKSVYTERANTRHWNTGHWNTGHLNT